MSTRNLFGCGLRSAVRYNPAGTFATMFPGGLCVWFLSVLGSVGATRPNVLMILADDLRPQLGCYGDRIVQTPHLDRFATRALRFERAYVQIAICSPSRNSFLSGLRPATTGLRGFGKTIRQAMPDVVGMEGKFHDFPPVAEQNAAFRRRYLQGYLASISYMDACAGRVLAALDAAGLRDNSIVLFAGDHGYLMGEHGSWGHKHCNYEMATRAPLLVAAPGMKAGGRSTRALVEFVDFYAPLRISRVCRRPPVMRERASPRCSLRQSGRGNAPYSAR